MSEHGYRPRFYPLIWTQKLPIQKDHLIFLETLDPKDKNPFKACAPETVIEKMET